MSCVEGLLIGSLALPERTAEGGILAEACHSPEFAPRDDSSWSRLSINDTEGMRARRSTRRRTERRHQNPTSGVTIQKD